MYNEETFIYNLWCYCCMEKKLIFESKIIENKGLIKTGRINSVKLIPFIGKKVRVELFEAGEPHDLKQKRSKGI